MLVYTVIHTIHFKTIFHHRVVVAAVAAAVVALGKVAIQQVALVRVKTIQALAPQLHFLHQVRLIHHVDQVNHLKN